MQREEIEGLLSAYGFSIDIEDPENKRIRFRGDDTFLDVWVTGKGVTVGVFNPHAKKMSYPVHRTWNLERIEDALIEAKVISKHD